MSHPSLITHLTMAQITPTERLEISLTTPAGEVTVPAEVPTGFVPVTAIVPILRMVGERAMKLEEHRAVETGLYVSCQKGCAACCRMLVPVSPPEAYALHDMIEKLSPDRRNEVMGRLDDVRRRLSHAGILEELSAIAETDHQVTDEEMEPINRAYFGLQIPCPFLKDEICSIYDDRPAACRELLVTSPADLCRDLVHNPVRPLPVPLRIGTVLGLLWANLTAGPIRFIPLPLAWDWADRRASNRSLVWQGMQLFEQGIEMVWRYLLQEFRNRGVPLPEQKSQ